jgi:hypothetical protein
MTRSQLALPTSGFACLVLIAAACTPSRMAVPKDVGSVSDEILITDRSGMSGALVDESFKMGTFQVVNVSRKWNSTSTTTIVGVSSADAQGGYTFGLRSPAGEYKGQCASRLAEQSTGFLGGTLGKQSFNVLCECAGPSQASLSMNAGTTSQYKGNLNARSASYVIEGIYTNDKGSSTSTPIGYHVHGSDPIGAVEVAGKGRVWLNKSLDPGARADVACLFAGLLLYKEPQGKMDK